MRTKKYTLFWLTGKAEVVIGTSIANAMSGYSAGALRALDFYAEGDQVSKYNWNKESRNWDSIDLAVSN